MGTRWQCLNTTHAELAPRASHTHTHTELTVSHTPSVLITQRGLHTHAYSQRHQRSSTHTLPHTHILFLSSPLSLTHTHLAPEPSLFLPLSAIRFISHVRSYGAGANEGQATERGRDRKERRRNREQRETEGGGEQKGAYEERSRSREEGRAERRCDWPTVEECYDVIGLQGAL